MKSEILFAYCTFPSGEVAESISQQLVAEGIIACANVFPPHKAIYSWKGVMQSESECAAIFKLNARKAKLLKGKIRDIHPYTNPALVFWRIEDGLEDFLKWVYAQSL